MKTKRKRSSPETKVIFRRNQVETKKKGLGHKIATIFGRKFVGCFSTDRLFFLWSFSAQLFMGGRLNFDGGTQNFDGGTQILDGGCVPPRPPYNFSSGTGTCYSHEQKFKTT